MLHKLNQKIQNLINFFSHEIWRINTSSKSNRKIIIYDIVKAFLLTFRNINSSQINTRAAALTYNSLLSIIPLLAVLFAIARGFGFQNIVESQLFEFFTGQKELLTRAMKFIDHSISYAQGGIFLGIGIILLFYTVITLLSNIEDNFNSIWRIQQGRSLFRKFTDYLALIVITPIFFICNAGLTIFLNSSLNFDFFNYVLVPIIKFVPFVIIILLFTILYIYIPNTKVKFKSALMGGLVSGSCFQIFQMLYISGQLGLSKYNAIYGSFAALPLLLFWLQLSWFICLFGVQLSYSYQNINKFSFERETSNISRRYKDFILLTIATLIIKRFETKTPPYTADEISETFKIPSQLVNDSLYYLLKSEIIRETPSNDEMVISYIPSIDINKISISFFFNNIDQLGSEDFKIDKSDEKIKNIWEKTLEIRQLIYRKEGDILLKDI
ncbi:YihY/virulence factor BrkB family protein [Apibacter muscae]|uniref:YihY/virulence factor BrkB family protein n=1 Tax=Apibacter muscae TaxID=2509004 RepID=A0A563DCN8_9FLAO|nr:YihY/virulence factor BrkB family protein [Apibacter muscae]TWP23942.1 YihY/virulence factor BrkB family protein [Apibacter muscae]TWP27857.1 YihY/virulence factor BrkB family protein [Apibacter muscae]TWP29678.1 YihY/virulence factor BrkB family protein [Apibacter muscae]